MPTSLKPYFLLTGIFSIVVNMTILVAPLYMLQVYDRILVSGSMDTLITISILAVFLLLVYGVAEAARRKIVTLASEHLQTRFGDAIFTEDWKTTEADQALPRDISHLSTLQAFLSNGLILPVFDLPFSPFFIWVMFLIHPLLGGLGLVAVIILLIIAFISETSTRKIALFAKRAENATEDFVSRLSRQRTAIVSLGMTRRAYGLWVKRKHISGRISLRSAHGAAIFSALSRSIRMILQISALGVGAWLVLNQQASSGAIVAGSVLMGRALGPISQLVEIWRQITRAREAWSELSARDETFRRHARKISPMPRPKAELTLQALAVGCPGVEQALLPKINFSLKGGTILPIIGRNGVGKTAFLQTISGAWPPISGHVMLHGRDLHLWDMEDRGPYIGYIPQNIELLPGTIAENIARFTDAPIETVIATAQQVGCHEMILSLSAGYDTYIGLDDQGHSVHLSAGIKQNIGIARAIFGNPVLLLLDEPSANLDQASIVALSELLPKLKAAGTIILVATHERRLIDLSENVLCLSRTDIRLNPTAAFMETLESGTTAPIPAKTE